MKFHTTLVSISCVDRDVVLKQSYVESADRTSRVIALVAKVMKHDDLEFSGIAILWEVHIHSHSDESRCRNRDFIFLSLQIPQNEGAIRESKPANQFRLVGNRPGNNRKLIHHRPVRADNCATQGV